jgi:hypothetical protein
MREWPTQSRLNAALGIPLGALTSYLTPNTVPWPRAAHKARKLAASFLGSMPLPGAIRIKLTADIPAHTGDRARNLPATFQTKPRWDGTPRPQDRKSTPPWRGSGGPPELTQPLLS